MSVKRETVQTKAGARGLLDSPIIASVGHEKKKRGVSGLFSRSKQGLQVFNPTTSFAYTEQISKICSQLDHENAAHGLKVFLVAGVGENEGKSTIAANVASALAMSGKNTALMTKEDKIAYIHYLDEHGAFLITKSGQRICEALSISKYTLYNYLEISRDAAKNS